VCCAVCRLTAFGCVVLLVAETGCVDAGMVLISCTILLDSVTYSLYMRCVYHWISSRCVKYIEYRLHKAQYILKALMEKDTEFHTYKPNQDRSIRVVLENFHPSTDLSDIKRSLTDKGHVATNIWNIKQRVTNKPLPMHFIDIKPHDNKEIYKISTVEHNSAI